MKKVLVTLIALSLPTFALADATKGFLFRLMPVMLL